MPKLVDYKVIRNGTHSDVQDFRKKILEHCQDGYELVGGLAATKGHDGYIIYSQAVAKYSEWSDSIITVESNPYVGGDGESGHLEFVNLDQTKFRNYTDLVPESVAREHNALIIDQSDDFLTIAISDPTDLEKIEQLRFILNRDVKAVLAPKGQIQKYIEQLYGE